MFHHANGTVQVFIAVTLLVSLASIAFVALRLLEKHLKKKNLLAEQFRLQPLIWPPIAVLITLIISRLYLEIMISLGPGWSQLYRIFFVASLAWLASVGLRLIFVILYQRFDFSHSDNLRQRKARTQLSYIESMAHIIVGFFALISILFSFEGWYELGLSLLTSAGVLSIIIGLAAQRYIGNLIAGFQIAFTQPIRLDDAVVVENEWGWIEEITLTYVVVRIWDWRRLVLPISYFTEKPFQNWTRKSAEVIGQVTLKVDFRSPIAAMRAELDRILDGNKLWDGKVKVLQVIDSEERSITVRILVSASNSPTAWDLRCLVREKMIEFLQQDEQNLPGIRIHRHHQLGDGV